MAALPALPRVSHSVRRGDGGVQPLLIDIPLSVPGGELVAAVGTRNAGETMLLGWRRGWSAPTPSGVR